MPWEAASFYPLGELFGLVAQFRAAWGVRPKPPTGVRLGEAALHTATGFNWSKALRAVLVECAHGAARTHGCQFRGYHKALMVRRGYKRAIVATAHKLLRVLYVVLGDPRPYRNPDADYEELMVRRNAPRWIRMLHRYGLIEHDPAPTATA